MVGTVWAIKKILSKKTNGEAERHVNSMEFINDELVH